MIEVRVPGPDEQGRFFDTAGAAFSEPLHPDDLERDAKMLDPARRLAAYEDGAMVGTAADFAFTFTIPGGELPAAGVTFVGVAPTHRRRGIMTALMRRQLDDARKRGEPLAILWSSEEPIYGRFGYGIATLRATIDADRDRMAFVGRPEPVGRVRLVEEEAAATLFAPVHERVRRETPGMFARSDDWWRTYRLADSEHRRHGAGPMFRALLELDGEPEAYALYRVKPSWEEGFSASKLHVIEAVATSPVAEREIWRFLFGVDLVGRVESWWLPPDHPLPLLVTEPRRLRLRLSDALWLRILDVGRALAARSYAADGSLTLDVADPLVADNAGRYRLEAAGGTARVERDEGEPELSLDVSELGSVFLGGVSFEQLARAGRVEELAQGAVARADSLFRTARAPWCPEVF